MIGVMRRHALILLLLFVAATALPALGCMTAFQPMSSLPCCQTMCAQPSASPQQSLACCRKMASQTAPPQQTLPAPARPVTVLALRATLAPAVHQFPSRRLSRTFIRRDASVRLSGSPPLFELNSTLLL